MIETGDDETVAAVRECARRLPADAGGERLVFGFDGYLDRVREVVAERHDGGEYTRMDALGALGEEIADSAAADTSLTFEWRQTGTRIGGHTCHLARAFARLGFDPVAVGTYGRPPARPFEALDCPTHSLGAPGETDAVEFADGKLLLTELGDSVDVDWATVRETVGVGALADHLDGASLLGVGYWAELPGFPSLLSGLREEVWPLLGDPPADVLVDTGDLRKRDGDLGAGAGALARLEGVADVTVSANRIETAELARSVGDGGNAPAGEPDALAANAAAARDGLGVCRVAGHGVERSVLDSGDGTASVAVPRTADPALTTSAGDHFNAGLALALVLGVDGGPAVALGNALAGWFVRHGDPPGYDDLGGFVASYLDRFDGGE